MGSPGSTHPSHPDARLGDDGAGLDGALSFLVGRLAVVVLVAVAALGVAGGPAPEEPDR